MEQFRESEFLQVTVRIDGSWHRAVAPEQRVYGDGSRALHLTLWPARRDGVRRAWYWWDPQAMRLARHAVSPIEREPQEGDAVRVLTTDLVRQPGGEWPPRPSPAPVRVRVGGQWHEGAVHRVRRLPDGRSVLLVRVVFVETDWPVAYWRRYWWDPEAIQPVTGSDITDRTTGK